MPRISIVVPVYSAGAFLDDAVRCVRAQTFTDWELLLFDDGSTDGSRERSRRLAEEDSRIRALAHPGHDNRGQLATRIAAANEARAELVAMLDQDDVWDADYLEKHLARWDAVAKDGVVLSYGPGLYWHPDAPDRDYVQPMPPGTPAVFDPPHLLEAFFANQYAATPLPSCTLIRRDVLRAAARFGVEARGSQCEDQYLSWFVAARWRIAIHAEPWVKYRQHGESALAKMLARPAAADAAEARFLSSARRELTRLHPAHPLLTSGALDARIREKGGSREASTLRKTLARIPVLSTLGTDLYRAGAKLGARQRLAYGLAPLSEAFGEDRGKPLTRHYVEQFLAEHATDIRGACLEFEGSDYTRLYGGDAVEHADVLDLSHENPAATVVADLTAENDLPSDRYDAIICTFVLHEIFDLTRAVAELHRILKPGGVMLIAVPHVTMCEPRYHELWRFTVQGLRELLARTFPAETTSIRAYGNSLTAAAQLRGLVAEELGAAELEFHDPRFAVAICARVVKPARPLAHAAASVRRGGASGNRGVVLLYHRSAAPVRDAHLLAVPPQRFAEHLDALCDLGHPMPLTDLSRAAAEDCLPERAIAVTFDDGYADNLEYARPALERRGVPATVFVTSGYVGAQREFWWDAIARLLLETPCLPEAFHFTLDGRKHVWSLDGDATWTDADFKQHGHWNVLDPTTPTKRHEIFRQALNVLRPLSDLRRRTVLNALFTQAGVSDAPRPTHRAMDPGELRALARDDLVAVGAHTITHAQLSALAPDEQRMEIAHGRARLEALLERSVESFAYPYGSPADYTEETVRLVREQGFLVACSNFPGVVTAQTSPHELPRLMVMDWSPDELARRVDALLSAS